VIQSLAQRRALFYTTKIPEHEDVTPYMPEDRKLVETNLIEFCKTVLPEIAAFFVEEDGDDIPYPYPNYQKDNGIEDE
jgi:hypothetical protein